MWFAYDIYTVITAILSISVSINGKRRGHQMHTIGSIILSCYALMHDIKMAAEWSGRDRNVWQKLEVDHVNMEASL